MDFLALILEYSFDVNASSSVHSVILEPAEVVSHQVQLAASIAPHKHNTFVVAILAESPGLLGVTVIFGAGEHHHQSPRFGLGALLDALNFVCVKLVAKLGKSRLEVFVLLEVILGRAAFG